MSNTLVNVKMMCIGLECKQSQQDSGEYKSATIALAVIALASIAVSVLLTIFLPRKTPTKGRFI